MLQNKLIKYFFIANTDNVPTEFPSQAIWQSFIFQAGESNLNGAKLHFFSNQFNSVTVSALEGFVNVFLV